MKTTKQLTIILAICFINITAVSAQVRISLNYDVESLKACSQIDSLTSTDNTELGENSKTLSDNIGTNGKHFNLFPNPSNGLVTISFPENNNELVTMGVFNSQGKLVKSLELRSSGTDQVDLQSLPSGLYFLTMNSGNLNYQTQKLIIN